MLPQWIERFLFRQWQRISRDQLVDSILLQVELGEAITRMEQKVLASEVVALRAENERLRERVQG